MRSDGGAEDLPGPANDDLKSKVIVRFRHRAGKNGQLFPSKSWSSGLLIITSQRIILADGPNHYIIPFNSILSIEDDGDFPIEDGPRDKLIPITFGIGLDYYLSMVGVPPVLKNILTKKIYISIVTSYKGISLIKDGEEKELNITLEKGEIYAGLQDGDPIHLSAERIYIDTYKGDEDPMVVGIKGSGDIQLVFRGGSAPWAKKLFKSIIKDKIPALEEKHRKVLEILSESPTSTSEITEKLNLVQLEGSTLINEMIFMELVAMDHATQLYTATARGRSVVTGSAPYLS